MAFAKSDTRQREKLQTRAAQLAATPDGEFTRKEELGEKGFVEFISEFDRIRTLCGRLAASNLHLPVSNRIRDIGDVLLAMEGAFETSHVQAREVGPVGQQKGAV